MIRVAVVGFGFMGVTHTVNILKNSEFELVAIVDKFPDNVMKNLNTQLGNFSTGSVDDGFLKKVNIYSDFTDCLRNEELDACVIAVHTNLHYEMTKMALSSGVNVFLEKPFCLNIHEGEELVKLAAEKGLVLMIGHVVRFMPAYIQLKEWIDQNNFGALQFLSLTRFSGLPAWGQWKEKRKNFGSSGGALFDLVIHDIDYVQWILGEPDSISSVVLPGQLSEYDYLNASWKYTSGITVKIEGGNIFHTAFPFQAGFTARFEQASVYYTSSSPENIKVCNDEEVKLVATGDANDGFPGEINYFAKCIINKTEPVVSSPESALKTVKLCHNHIR
jgi:predicted dehydrogenase